MKKIGIFALENCMHSSVTGAFDILTVASSEWKKLYGENNGDLFGLTIFTDNGQNVTSFNGIKIEAHKGRNECDDLDIIFIPVVHGELDSILTSKGLIDWLYQQHKKGVIICAVCAGVFLAAQTGILNNRKATTHWQLADDFQERYPEVVLKKEQMIVDEGVVITAGGVTAYMDLALYLAGRFGTPELTSILSKLLLIDPARRLQTPYKGFDFNKLHSDQEILKVQNWMAENITKSITVPGMAQRAGLGVRTFMRRFKKSTGDTPTEYLQHLRIGKARSLLETTSESFDTITCGVGYEDVSSFRRLFKKSTGLSPAAYRKRFGLY